MKVDSGAYREFLQAASQVPEALPRPVSLQPDLKVVLNVPRGSPVALECRVEAVLEEAIRKRARSATGAVKEVPKEAEEEREVDYDGCCGVLLGESEGLWKVEVTRRGVTRLGTMKS